MAKMRDDLVKYNCGCEIEMRFDSINRKRVNIHWRVIKFCETHDPDSDRPKELTEEEEIIGIDCHPEVTLGVIEGDYFKSSKHKEIPCELCHATGNALVAGNLTECDICDGDGSYVPESPNVSRDGKGDTNDTGFLSRSQPEPPLKESATESREEKDCSKCPDEEYCLMEEIDPENNYPRDPDGEPPQKEGD